MTYTNLKEKEVIIDVESGEATSKSDGMSGELVQNPNEALELLVQKNSGEVSVEKERRKAGKPPRPPNGPTLDAADMRLIKEFTKVSMKKRERIEQIKALKKMQAAAKLQPPPSLSSLCCASTAMVTIAALLFLLVLILQGLGAKNGPSTPPRNSSTPAPEQ